MIRALPAALALVAAVASAQTTSSRAPARTTPPCRPITNAMLQGPLSLTLPCYTIDQFATADHPVIIAPGTSIIFGGGAALALNANGSLDAAGTAERPIVLRGRERSPGFWRGLTIGSNSSHNRLSHVTLEDGGEQGVDNATVLLTTGARVAMDHTTIRRSPTNGLLLMQGAAFARFEANRFEETDTPLRVKASDLASLDAATIFTRNRHNVVSVQFGEGDVVDDALWRALPIPYRFEGGIDIRAKVTIEPGARLEFRENVSVHVDANGSLTAVGTPATPVVFTAPEETSGYWAGIFFESNSSRNVLRNVEVSYGGSRSGAFGAAVAVLNNASLTIQSSTLGWSPVAILVKQGGTLNADAASSNTFHDDGQTVVNEP